MARKTDSIMASGVSVRIYKRGASPIYFCSFRLDGQKIQRSTKQTHRERAEAEARTLVSDEIKNRLLHVTPGPTLTWGQLFDVYQRDRVPDMSDGWQRWSKLQAELFKRAFGIDALVMDLDQQDVDRFTSARTGGHLFPNKMPAKSKRRAVTEGTVEASFRWLSSVCRWAMRRRVNGERLLTSNPLDGVERPKKNRNPRRPKSSHERYVASLAQTDVVDPTGALRLMLVAARYTGHRIGAICALKAAEVLRTPEQVQAALAAQGADVALATAFPHGAIVWSAESDKMGLGWITPTSPVLRAELDRYLAKSPAIGAAPLFPAPRRPAESFSPLVAARWLVAAERRAKLPKLAGGVWHPYRRLFATELAGVPAKVAATLGGWKDPRTMQVIYQQPEGVELYAAALQVGKAG